MRCVVSPNGPTTFCDIVGERFDPRLVGVPPTRETIWDQRAELDEEGAERVAERWLRTPVNRAAERRTNWLEHPRLLHYAAKRGTGNRFGESWRWAIDRDHSRPVDRVLSLGCGGGGLERRVAKLRCVGEHLHGFRFG